MHTHGDHQAPSLKVYWNWISLAFTSISCLITHLCVRHPTAGFHLIGVEAPEFEFLLEQRATHVCGVVELSRSEMKKCPEIYFTIATPSETEEIISNLQGSSQLGIGYAKCPEIHPLAEIFPARDPLARTWMGNKIQLSFTADALPNRSSGTPIISILRLRFAVLTQGNQHWMSPSRTEIGL